MGAQPQLQHHLFGLDPSRVSVGRLDITTEPHDSDSRYAHSPYGALVAITPSTSHDDAHSVRWPAAACQLLHFQLSGRVSFISFSDTALAASGPVPHCGTQPFELFIGMLPFDISAYQVAWLVNVFGCGALTQRMHRIHDRMGSPKGCFFVTVDSEDTALLLKRNLHDRVLFDEEGVWFAASLDQQEILESYCRMIRGDTAFLQSMKRRPYKQVVVEPSDPRNAA